MPMPVAHEMAELLDEYYTRKAELEGHLAPQVCVVSHVVVTFVDGDGELTMRAYSDDVLNAWRGDIEDWLISYAKEAAKQGREPSYLEALEATMMEGRDQ